INIVSDRWYYMHHDQTFGPVSEQELRALAARRELLPDDLIWLEDEGLLTAVEARAALAFSGPAPAAPASGAAPDWLADIAQTEKPVARPPAAPGRVKTPAKPPASREAIAVELAPPLLPPSVGPCRISVGCATSRGMVRKRNEDHFLVQQFIW